MLGQGDWALKCKDGKLLSCHSLFLTSFSGELANIGKTVNSVVNKETEIPVEETAEVTEAFLGWVYGHNIHLRLPWHIVWRLSHTG